METIFFTDATYYIAHKMVKRQEERLKYIGTRRSVLQRRRYIQEISRVEQDIIGLINNFPLICYLIFEK